MTPSLTPERQAFLVNIVARNCEIDARQMSGPWAASAQAASDSVRELSTALASAKAEERAAVVAETRHRAAEWESVGVKDDARVLREHADAIESGRHRGKA